MMPERANTPSDSELDELTDEQRVVVECAEPCFVEACPGAGKTRTIVSLFLHATRRLSAREGVVVLSFTNVAAEEVRARANGIGLASRTTYPNFLGTFDAFIGRYLVTPFGNRWCSAGAQPRIVESWRTLGLEVRCGAGPGVPLDAFLLDEHEELRINERAIPFAARKNVLANRAVWIRAAEGLRERLARSGYMSCHDARLCAVLRLRDKERGSHLVRALTSRFKLLIVDEAQDSNPTDLEVVEALASAGMRTVIVADPDQSIFEFRGAETSKLEASAARRKRLRLSGNFRSSQTICRATSSLKRTAGADVSLGSAAQATSRVVVLGVDGAMDARVGKRFCAEAIAMSLDPSRCVALAYQEETAMGVVGIPWPDIQINSVLDSFADAVATFRRSDVDGRRRHGAVVAIERLLVRRLGLDSKAGSPSDTAEANGVPARWLRRTALQLLGALSAREVADTHGQRWIDFARDHMSRVSAPPGRAFVRSSAEVIRNKATWSPPPSSSAGVAFPATTIHAAKGRQFDGVLLVMNEHRFLDQAFTAWEQRTDDESRRVYYVGATRARRILALAVPLVRAERARALLSRDGASVDRVDVTA